MDYIEASLILLYTKKAVENIDGEMDIIIEALDVAIELLNKQCLEIVPIFKTTKLYLVDKD